MGNFLAEFRISEHRTVNVCLRFVQQEIRNCVAENFRRWCDGAAWDMFNSLSEADRPVMSSHRRASMTGGLTVAANCGLTVGTMGRTLLQLIRGGSGSDRFPRAVPVKPAFAGINGNVHVAPRDCGPMQAVVGGKTRCALPFGGRSRPDRCAHSKI